jgi:predicted ATPase
VVEEFEDGAWLVELAPLSDPELVPRAVASVLGIREAPGTTLLDSLVAHLEARESLLVLDNCEHLVETCAEMVATLLGSCRTYGSSPPAVRPSACRARCSSPFLPSLCPTRDTCKRTRA